ncbi:interferon-induced protein 44-like [Crassostrea virginica]
MMEFKSTYPHQPWRKFPSFSEEILQELKTDILNYTPVNENVSSANILLIGQIGAGKSSVLNSVNSIYRGKITSRALCGSFEHSLTTTFRKYNIKDYNSGQTLKLRLCDTRGLEEEFTADVQEMSYILDGNVPDRYQFNPTSPFNTKTPGFIPSPKFEDKIHCMAFVLDGSTIDVMPEKILTQIKAIQNVTNLKNIPQVVYVTKMDKVCSDVQMDPTIMFHNESVCEAVNKTSNVMGIPRGHIYPIINYESETTLDANLDILLLQALKQTASFADDFIDDVLGSFKAPSPWYCSIS